MAGESSGAAPTEVFGEAAKSGLTALNASVLATCTVVGAGLSVYGDIAQGAGAEAAVLVAIALWLATLLLTLYLAGRGQQRAGFASTMRGGLGLALRRPAFTAFVLLVTAGAAFSVWSRARSDHGGVLQPLLKSVQRVEGDTAQIKAVVTREVPPAEQLSRLGYTMAKEDICRALTTGQSDVWRLMQSVGLPPAPVEVPVGGGQQATCIEEALLSRTQRIPSAQMLAGLPNPNHELDRLYIAQAIGTGREEPVDAAALARSAGVRTPHSLAYVFAPLMMYAVWGGDPAAVRALLTAGANPDAAAKIELMGPGVPSRYAVLATPMAEAERLNQREIMAALREAGAHASVHSAPSMFAVQPPAKTARQKPSQPW